MYAFALIPMKNKTILFLLYVIVQLNAETNQGWAKTKVACMGDSVTAGYMLGNPITEAYPSQLQGLLGETYEVKNFGFSGATLLKKGHRPYVKTKAYQEALQFQPDIAIIHLGLNDTDPRNWPNYKQDFQSDYHAIIQALRAQNPTVKIFICKMTPIFNEHPRFQSGTRDWFWEIQAEIKTVAQENKVHWIDLHEKLYARPDLFPDALHPSKEGAATIAKTVYSALTGDFGGFALAPQFADHMVLQRQQPITFFGKANTGDLVEVTFNGQTLSTTATTNGKWSVQWPSMKAGGPYELKVRCQNQWLEVKNILIGDVWFCSGQSNMAFPLQKEKMGATALAKAASNDRLRLMHWQPIQETDDTAWDSLTLAKTNELNYFSGKWQRCDSLSTKAVSAIAYYFGQKILQEEKVPIGIIQVAVGGSPIESWVDRYTLEHDAKTVNAMTQWRKSDFYMPWVRERAEVNLKNALTPKQRHPYDPCYNFEAGVSAFTAFPIKGILWYQGESNVHNLAQYQHLLPVMVQSWRKAWGQDLPFFFVQLSGMNRPAWPEFRWMQSQLSETIPNSGLAVSMDFGEENNVHPIQKEAIANRLARLALHRVYHKPIQDQGPKVSKAVQTNETIVLSFTQAKQLQTEQKAPLRGFEIVTNEGQYLPVPAEIKQNKVLLIVPKATQVRAVVYAWQPFTLANLTNEAGLPSSTFKIAVSQN